MDVDGENETHSDEEGYGFRSPVEKGISLVARIFTGVVKVLKAIVTPFLYLIGGILLFSLLATWLGLTAGASFLAPHSHFLTHGPAFLGYVGMFNAVFAVGIPLLIIILSITKRLFKFKINKVVTTGLIVFAVVNFFSFASIAGRTAKDFKVETSQYDNVINGMHDADTLHLHMVENIEVGEGFVHLGDGVEFFDDKVSLDIVDIDIRKSSKNDFEVGLKKSSWGANSVASEKYIEDADYNIRVEDNHIYVPESYVISKGGKFRGQKMEVTINVPEGKYLALDKSVRSSDIHHMDIDEAYIREFSRDGMVWKMGDKGLTNEVAKREQIEDYRDFDKLDIKGNYRVYVERSDDFEIKIVGNDNKYYKSEINKVGGLLEVRYDRNRGSRPIKLYVKMPKLESIKLTKTHDVKIVDFDQTKMLIENEGVNTEIIAHIDVEHLEIKMKGSQSELELHGEGKSILADLGQNVTLDAGTFEVNRAELNGSYVNEAYVYATESFVDNTTQSSKVKNKFTPDRDSESEKLTIGFSTDEGVIIKKAADKE